MKIIGWSAWFALGCRPIIMPSVMPQNAPMKYPGISSPIELKNDAISRGLAELDERVEYRLERFLALCIVSLSLGGVALCLAVGSMIFAL